MLSRGEKLPILLAAVPVPVFVLMFSLRLVGVLLTLAGRRLGPASHSRSSSCGKRRRSSATQLKLLYRLGVRGLSPTAGALSLLERRGGIESEPKLEPGVCDDEAVEGGEAAAVIRADAPGVIVVAVAVTVAVDVLFGVEAKDEVLLMAVLVLISLLNRAAAAAAGPLVARVVDVVVWGQMEYVEVAILT